MKLSPRTARGARRLLAPAAACLLAGPAAAHAALGDPDPSYGVNGVAVSELAAQATDGHLDAAGRAVLAGLNPVAGSAAQDEGVVVRLTPAGATDPTWGAGGRSALGEGIRSIALAPAPDGTWVVASVDGNGQLVLTRLSADGQPQASSTSGANYAGVGDVEVLRDGRIVVGGTTTGASMFVARFNAAFAAENGAPMPAAGRVLGVAVDALDRVLLAGDDDGNGTGLVVRTTPSGTIDPSFAVSGSREIGTVLRDVEAMADGRILLAGSNGNAGIVARLTSTGALEDGFGTTGPGGGVISYQRDFRATRFTAVTTDAVGGIYAAGDTDQARLLVYRFDSGGFPDPAFGPRGYRDIEGARSSAGVALDAQERPHVLADAGGRPAAARLLPNAAPVAALAAPDRVAQGTRGVLDASGSIDPERALRRFEWDLDGDGAFETEGAANPAVAHDFPIAGARTVAVRVTDHRGLQATAARTVQVDPPAGPSPILGRAFVASPAGGTILIRRPGEARYSRLEPGTLIPEGTLVDARRGRVTIAVARDRTGAVDTGVFHLGRFRITQTDGEAPYTTLSLFGGDFRGCGRARPKLKVQIAAKKSKKRVIRRLWGDGEGRFRTKGRYASATVRGTRWQTIDRCDGVKLQVVQGTVDFRDLLRATKARRVRAGRTDFVPSRRNK